MTHYKWIKKAKECPEADLDNDDEMKSWKDYGRRSVNIHGSSTASARGEGDGEPLPFSGTTTSLMADDYDPRRDYAGNYEDYITKAYKGVNDKFNLDPNLRRLSAEAKLTSRFNPILTLSRMAQEEANDDRQQTVDTLYQIYKANPDEMAEDRSEFEVYKPRYTSKIEVKTRKEPYASVAESRTRMDSMPSSCLYTTPFRDYGPYASTSGLSQPSRPNLSTFRNATAQPPDRTITVDYKNTRLGSSTAYGRSDYVRPQDTALHGSNFTIITQRQPDAWFSKVDKLLAEVRSGT